jgi:hypothetical protein
VKKLHKLYILSVSSSLAIYSTRKSERTHKKCVRWLMDHIVIETMDHHMCNFAYAKRVSRNIWKFENTSAGCLHSVFVSINCVDRVLWGKNVPKTIWFGICSNKSHPFSIYRYIPFGIKRLKPMNV